MPNTIRVKNINDKPFGLVIEPWAQYEKIAPGSCAEIVLYNEEPDDVLDVTLTEDGDVFIAPPADIVFSIDDREIIDTRSK